MPHYLTNDDQSHLLEWARQRIVAMVEQDARWPMHAQALGVRELGNDKLVAVMVTVQTYQGIIDLHFASDGARSWCSRNVMRGLFGWLFLVLKAHRVQTIHSVDHKKSSSLIMRMGFTVEARLRSAVGPGEDGLLFSMLKRECPWLDPQDKRMI